MRTPLAALLLALAPLPLAAQQARPSTRENYTKLEYRIPMRDGVRLMTTVYVPKDKPGPHPILLERTPYSAGPYGPEAFKGGFRGSPKFREAGYVFAFQDVRGRYMSEGVFEHIRPQLRIKTRPFDVDESTDTYDTVDYLVKNVPRNNGRVGLWGISYPGGYAALGAVDSHPALKATSPQAPTAEWFLGDDMHHNGAFFLQDCFSFMSSFEGRGDRFEPAPSQTPLFRFDIQGDAYKFFLGLGPIKNTQKPEYFGGRSRFWNDVMRHGTYDDYWQARSVPASMTGVKAGMLWVGGWFDAEDLYGPLHCYASAERQNRSVFNALVMGPWQHGGWAGSGASLGDIGFGSATGTWYQENIEFPFFDAFLRGNGKPKLPEASVFMTGSDVWRTFSSWPPRGLKKSVYHLGEGGTLADQAGPAGQDSYESDPASPVPYEGGTLARRSRTYMIADQRFASARPDVLTYQTAPLARGVVWAGPVKARLRVNLTGSDADFVVKVVDVHPDGSRGHQDKDLSGYQQLVRAEIFRGKFRHSFSNPKPFLPGVADVVEFDLPDVFHEFQAGHRIMVQVQSSWFPLVDRNPQTFCDIYSCGEEAFQKATVTLLRGGDDGSRIEVGTLGK